MSQRRAHRLTENKQDHSAAWLHQLMNIDDIIKDNDPRAGHRLLIIESFDGPDHVRARRLLSDGRRNSYPKKGFRIALSRIHTDGKKRNGGFSLENAIVVAPPPIFSGNA